jgi:hypothetical protein
MTNRDGITTQIEELLGANGSREIATRLLAILEAEKLVAFDPQEGYRLKPVNDRRWLNLLDRATASPGELTLTTRARCFRGANGGAGILGTYRFTVAADGTVRMYDDTAKHFTLAHGMKPREESRIRNLARRNAEDPA